MISYRREIHRQNDDDDPIIACTSKKAGHIWVLYLIRLSLDRSFWLKRKYSPKGDLYLTSGRRASTY